MGIEQLRELKRVPKKNELLRCAVSDLTLDELIQAEARQGKLLSPTRRRKCIDRVHEQLKVSERRARQVLQQHRPTQRHGSRGRADENRLVADMIGLAQ